MNDNNVSYSIASKSAIENNKVIKNTYTLLSMTLVFSAVMAALSMSMIMPAWTYTASMLVAIALVWFVLPATDRSASGVGVVFAITGLMGFGLGPVLNMYLSLPRGAEIIATAMGGTGAIFLGLSLYALTTRKDFSFLGGFLFVGIFVMLLASLANIFFAIPALSLTISSAMVLLMSGYILYDTSRIIHGGETNYIRATVELYLDIFNLFLHLLQLLTAFSSDE
jgi:modulator of FtsH protease